MSNLNDGKFCLSPELIDSIFNLRLNPLLSLTGLIKMSALNFPTVFSMYLHRLNLVTLMSEPSFSVERVTGKETTLFIYGQAVWGLFNHDRCTWV